MAGKPPKDTGGGRGESGQPRGQGDSGQEPSFGSFISDSVRRSAGQFRSEQSGSSRRTRSSRSREDDAPRERSSRFSRDQPRRARRPGERQRRKPAAEDATDSQAEAPPPAASQPQDWLQLAVDRAGSPERALMALAVAVVALIALIWLLSAAIGGDDGDDDPAPTETLQVLPIGGESTPGDPEADGAPTAPEPTRDVIPTLPPVDLTGGSDNTLDEEPPPEDTPVAERKEPTASCSEACLARVERSPDAERVLASAGTRPSFSGEAWLWFVGQPEQIEMISSEVETTVIRESDDTLRLYMAMLPGPGQVEWAASQLGKVIDSVDTYRLVEAPSAPANVRATLDAGLIVEKVAPPPPETSTRPESPSTLEADDLWGLVGQVDSGRIESLIQELQETSSNDGSGIGTRHYTATGNQMAADALYRELESYGFTVWYEDFVTWQGLLVVNVIGELPGRDESRLYGVMAHFDSISDQPTVAAPGADDNATGVAGALEIARVLSGYEFTYSMRVAFVNVEEEGIIGAERFASNAVSADEPWEGVFNLDSIGASRHGYQIYLNATGNSLWMTELIQRVNSGYGIGEQLVVHQSDEIVADDNQLREQGMESVLIARELYGMSPVHHSSDDVIENVSIDHTRTAAALILLSIGSLLV